MKPRHLRCLAHFGDPPDGSIDVRESVYMYIYNENIVREHLTDPQHYPDNGLVSGTRGEVSRNQEEEDLHISHLAESEKTFLESCLLIVGLTICPCAREHDNPKTQRARCMKFGI
ncbi:hypothetical protein AVEN_101484-1 [Araneus ventricosus]|uniref:Uncharacterized protein n=1 Tax=Araneus ventricosus TaxID=182803 RepID=A0A4Y2K1X2_ARAVE|nr:hypothetical protein AVEN_101484-1 [Araneus ventricosus]